MSVNLASPVTWRALIRPAWTTPISYTVMPKSALACSMTALATGVVKSVIGWPVFLSTMRVGVTLSR
jgi:hypothetical protein